MFFLKHFSFGCFFHIFAVVNQLPGFSISRLANVEDFLNVNIFFNCKYKCEWVSTIVHLNIFVYYVT